MAVIHLAKMSSVLDILHASCSLELRDRQAFGGRAWFLTKPSVIAAGTGIWPWSLLTVVCFCCSLPHLTMADLILPKHAQLWTSCLHDADSSHVIDVLSAGVLGFPSNSL
jgi:hypothetical protein